MYLKQNIFLEDNMEMIKKLALILILIGGLNWGLVGILNFDLVAAIFGAGSLLSRIVYSLVGVSAIYYIISWYKAYKNK